jgi:hypothetical protein
LDSIEVDSEWEKHPVGRLLEPTRRERKFQVLFLILTYFFSLSGFPLSASPEYRPANRMEEGNKEGRVKPDIHFNMIESPLTRLAGWLAGWLVGCPALRKAVAVTGTGFVSIPPITLPSKDSMTYIYFSFLSERPRLPVQYCYNK